MADDDAATERLAGDRRIEHYELDPETLEEDEATRPRSTHILLDRTVPRSGAELTVDDAPNVLAFLSVYGKRTDREARLEVTTDRGEHFADVRRLIAEILGDAVGRRARGRSRRREVGVRRGAELAVAPAGRHAAGAAPHAAGRAAAAGDPRRLDRGAASCAGRAVAAATRRASPSCGFRSWPAC